jgi:hypothetical protein
MGSGGKPDHKATNVDKSFRIDLRGSGSHMSLLKTDVSQRRSPTHIHTTGTVTLDLPV